MRKTFAWVISLLFLLTPVLAQEEDVFADIGDVELTEGAGITPDHPLYGIDGFIEKILVGDNPERALKVKEEKVSEAKLMIEAGKVDEAKLALERVGIYADILEREVSPDIERRARESSKATQELFDELEKDLSGEEWGEIKDLIDDHGEKENRIALAAKISSKVKDLCETLALLDPVQYSTVCKTEDDAPKWQRELDAKLTGEQKKEAEEFFDIMSACFKDPANCQCEEISIPAFADKCSTIAPLAAACDGGDEEACSRMDRIEDEEPIEDLLPPHLQQVLFKLEDRYEEDRFEHHMPRECEEAGALDKESCSLVMFKKHAPKECMDALERGEIDFSTEDSARDACEEIMEKNAISPECRDLGVEDPAECKRAYFKKHAHEECVAAGLTGDSEEDWEKCREIVDEVTKIEPPKGFYPFQGAPDCSSISDARERLDCYDKISRAVVEDYPKEYEKYAESKGREYYGAFREDCDSDQLHICNNEGRECKCVDKEDYDNEHSGTVDTGYREDDPSTWGECKDGCEDECGDRNSDCSADGMTCICYDNDDDDDHGAVDGPGSGDDGPDRDDSGDSDSGSDDSNSDDGASDDSGSDSSGSAAGVGSGSDSTGSEE